MNHEPGIVVVFYAGVVQWATAHVTWGHVVGVAIAVIIMAANVKEGN